MHYFERAIPRSAAWAWDHIQSGWSLVEQSLSEDPERWFWRIIATILLVVALYQLHTLNKITRRLRNGKRFGRGNMSSELRERELVADAVCEALEKLYYENKLTLRKRNQWYARIGKAHALRDLFPKKKRCSKGYCIWLKDKIVRRREAADNTPPNIPGPAIGEVVPYAAPIRKKGVIFGKRKA